MGKRSNFTHNPRNYYRSTDPKIAERLVPHLKRRAYIEPCAGAGDLINLLKPHGVYCSYACDIEPLAPGIIRRDVLMLGSFPLPACDQIITNPPWERNKDGTGPLHEMIDKFRRHAPTWLLIDAGWIFTDQSKPYMRYLHKIIPVGRIKWFPDSKCCGMEDCIWVHFREEENSGYAEYLY